MVGEEVEITLEIEGIEKKESRKSKKKSKAKAKKKSS